VFRFAPFCLLQLAILDLNYFSAKIRDTLHQSESTGAGMLVDIAVRIVGIYPPQEEREMGLALSVVSKLRFTLII
jgi:hypothetical protein